ncbi:MAG: hypothetical protein GKR89_22785 [Candidatus Latescibacteria bacterium]|nr:hypothetical protein [Candidatus Latescibacterota bacterium]
MRMGLFTRKGKYLTGRIGDLTLQWDRHRGGALSITRLIYDQPMPVGQFTMHARLTETTLQSAADPDPRLIVVEAGPHRLVLRAVQRLYDEAGLHLGDAMQETWAWADGSLHLNAMLRLVHSKQGGNLLEAVAHFHFDAAWTAAGQKDIRLSHPNGAHLALLCHRNGEAWAVPPGDAQPAANFVSLNAWEAIEPGPPYYRRWGPYYDQWGGTGGWSSLRLEEGPSLRAVWAEKESRQRGPTEAFHGHLALLAAATPQALEDKIGAFQQPLAPTVEGGKLLYYSPMEGTTIVRKTADRLHVTFPADAHQRQTRLHVRLPGDRGMQHLSNPALGLPITHGGSADDPNGPNLLRPDDRHGPILTNPEVRPDELLTTFPLSADRTTPIEITSTPGLSLASQRWDERQQLLLYSSAHPQGALGALSLRDLKMRDLTIPGDAAPSMANLPLYWFQANAHSAHHCVNEPHRIDLLDNGPDAVHMRIVGRNPAGTAESDIELRMPFLQDRLQLDMSCRFSALETWDQGAIQYCNFFPEDYCYPQTWGTDRVLVLASDGQRMRIDHRGTSQARIQSGQLFQRYAGDLFVALYGGSGGSILALSRPRRIDGIHPEYQLCPSWIDNHLYLASDSDELPAGSRYEVDLTIVLAHTSDVDPDIEELGRAALQSGQLDL